MSEHRVSMLGTSWRRYEDPVHSRDPRVRAVVGALAALPSPAPDPEFRTELRAQLVAIAPRIIAENAAAGLTGVVPGKARTGKAARARHTDSVPAKQPRIRIGRPLAIAAAVATAFALLFGGAVWMSQKALPGDALYGLKRASESWELSTAGSPTDKAKDYLKFAQTRADEARALLSRATGEAAGGRPQASGLNSHTAGLIASTLTSADHDVKSASALLGDQAVANRSASPLSILIDWAPGQLGRLRALANAMPNGALQSRTESSAQLVARAQTRARQLAATVGCANTADRDELGPLPVHSCTTGTSQTPKKKDHPAGKTHSAGSNGVGGNGGTSSGSPQPSRSVAPNPTSSPSRSTLPINIPSVSIPPPPTSLPVKVNTCSLQVSLGPLGVNVGVCAS